MTAGYIDRLPMELLKAVFVDSMTEKGVVDPHLSPLLLCHVCSVWRAVAVRIPELWDTLAVKLPYNASNETCSSIADIVQFWLNNTGKSPAVSLSLRHPWLSPISTKLPPNLAPLDIIITSKASHFRTLELEIESNSDLGRVFSLPCGSFEHLEDLSLRLTRLEPTTVFQDATSLRKLSLSLYHKPRRYLNPIPSLFPWGQLTHLTMDGSPAYDMWREFFRHCLALEYCSLLFPYLGLPETTPLSNPGHTVVFLHLTILKFLGLHDFSLSLNGFEFPALTTLEICDSECREEKFWTRLMSPHHGLPLSNLHRLCLRDCNVSHIALRNILYTTMSLVDLVLTVDAGEDPNLTESILDRFTLATRLDATDDILPKLEVLSISVYNFSPCESSSLLHTISKMIESRWRVNRPSNGPYARLRRVSLEIQANYDNLSALAEQMETKLALCRDEGLDLQTSFVECDGVDDDDSDSYRSSSISD